MTALACALVWLTPLGAPYSAERPQRVMLFHTRRTLHGPAPRVENFYWMPELDANTPHSLDSYGEHPPPPVPPLPIPTD